MGFLSWMVQDGGTVGTVVEIVKLSAGGTSTNPSPPSSPSPSAPLFLPVFQLLWLSLDSEHIDLDIMPIPLQTRGRNQNPPSCAFPGCKVPPTKTCSSCLDTRYCSKERQIAHRKWHKKICVAPQKKPLASVPPAPTVSLKGSVEEEEDDGDTCIIWLENVANAKLRSYGHLATCRECTEQLRNLKEPCPLCRKKIAGFTVGKWQSTIGEHGLWPTSPENLAQLASGESFNEYFQNQFNGNEASYLRWKEVFDVLEIGNARDVGPDLPLEQQALMITRSEDLGKLKALAKLCSNQFFDDKSLLVVAWRRILEVLVLAMPPVVDEK
ncbi:hypothetical protein TL16_g05890 [Triparma laevis f. inornata]|uniref:MYND-type domain-containing protein n=1 Tax=Triparma laevis f. inornata TaxID=1714386 RepID=A0A9W7EDG8_9STRA|nr:hypothetical protein TL16_g05890 [Triparma laevis f. inornata]